MKQIVDKIKNLSGIRKIIIFSLLLVVVQSLGYLSMMQQGDSKQGATNRQVIQDENDPAFLTDEQIKSGIIETKDEGDSKESEEVAPHAVPQW